METLKIVVLFLSCTAVITQGRVCAQDKYRLPGDVEPNFYTIKIRPDLENDEFLGEVTIQVKIEKAVPFIELHTSDLNITEVFFDLVPVRFLNGCPCRFSEGYGYDFQSFELIKIRRLAGNDIPPGVHILNIKYVGEINKKTTGFFKGEYQKNGTTRHLLATDFEPTSARKVFPCFDEPRFKAIFQLNIFTPNDSYIALSNMKPQVKISTSKGILYKFQPTPPMSPYLLAFTITQCNYTEFITDENLNFRLYSPDLDQQNNTRLLKFASEVIRFYSIYTNFKFSLPKIDFIGFNRNISSATENWGLVTFNTSLISSNNEFYDESQKMSVIAHELAHFWFGNLVTNDWWDDIWLQESLATFMSLKAEDAILNNSASNFFPDLYMENLFFIDQSRDSMPVVFYQEEPSKITQNFNDITYNKGATILRMVELVIGEEKLKEAIRKYIKKFAYKTASTDDFVSSLYEFSDEVALRDCIETFLYQVGFPVIFVEEENDVFVLRQKSVREASGSIFGSKWTIPITYKTDTNDLKTVWFYKEMDYLTIDKNNATWIILNPNRISYYRTNYNPELWKKLISSVRSLVEEEKKHLILEATASFELNLTSCDPILQIFWETSKYEALDLDTATIVYLKLSDILKSVNDQSTIGLLKSFFGCVFRRAGFHFFANKLLKTTTPNCNYNFDVPVLYNEENGSMAEQIRSCLVRLQTQINVTVTKQ